MAGSVNKVTLVGALGLLDGGSDKAKFTLVGYGGTLDFPPPGVVLVDEASVDDGGAVPAMSPAERISGSPPPRILLPLYFLLLLFFFPFVILLYIVKN